MGKQPLQIRPGIACVLFDNEEHVLLHRRRIGEGWAPPSGSVEPGEDLQAALRREVREETSLEIEVDRLVGIYSDPVYQIVEYPGGQPVHFITSLFACRVDGGALRGSDEGTEWRWVPPGDWSQPLLPYAERWLKDALAGRSSPAIR